MYVMNWLEPDPDRYTCFFVSMIGISHTHFTCSLFFLSDVCFVLFSFCVSHCSVVCVCVCVCVVLSEVIIVLNARRSSG